jgi:hypothetical protein
MPIEGVQDANVNQRPWGNVVCFLSFCLSIRREKASQRAKQTAIVRVNWHAESGLEFVTLPNLACYGLWMPYTPDSLRGYQEPSRANPSR